ncbi:TPR repeat protein [Kutzneria buriramensis]|uniref:TPR repeat protein n=2 Tax=Kutzneria buriramensis TaxID=1045776 RepID=A0A3E0GVI7_9PSEU|nr:TPR repeat protein [Kutzneria buriramensis]
MTGERKGREAALAELRVRLANGLARTGRQKSQLARLAGLSRTTVQAAFRPGGPAPTAATVAKLADKLGLPVQELLDLHHAATAPPHATPSVEDRPGKAIGQWDPHDLEVHPAGPAGGVDSSARSRRALPGYVRRAHDGVLAEAVRDAAAGHSRMLVLVGSSSTGKTRACWEAVQPLAAHGWRLWHPHDPTRAEAALAELDRVAPCTVVWLNEAQHYLGRPQHGERIAAALHTLLTDPDRSPVLVVGTLWPDYANTYALVPPASGPDPHSRVRELLTGRTLTVPDAFDQEALEAATALAQGGDEFIEDALTRAQVHGRLTQDLAGAPELLRRYEQGTPPVRALLEAAMDARRLGVGLHLEQAFLIDAASDYFADQDYDQRAEDWAEAAFADLARPVHGKQAPLRRTAVRRVRRPGMAPVPAAGVVFRLADYLEQHGRATRRRKCPPGSFWDAAHTYLTDAGDLNNLAEAAYRRCRLQWAHHLRQRAADAGHPDALQALARLREEDRDLKGAEALYRRAADAGKNDALIALARLREEDRDLEGAEAFYRRAVDAGQAYALIALARLREQAGDREGAEALARQAIDAVVDPFALDRLARLREEAGDREGAEALARQAPDAGHPFALRSLAQIRMEAGDLEGAEALYRGAADAGNSDALAALAWIRMEVGDLEGAEALYRRAVKAGYPAALPELARIRKKMGDLGDSAALYRRAVDAGYPTALPELARIRKEAGDLAVSTAFYSGIGDARNTDALAVVARMREEAGDVEGAEALYRRVADAGGAYFLRMMGRMREEAGDLEAAEALYNRATEALYRRVDGIVNPSVLLVLARMREEAGDVEGAEALYRRAADIGDPFVLLLLAWMRVDSGDLEGAEAFAWRAADGGYADALLVLARMREEHGDLKGAEDLYRKIADAGCTLGTSKSRWPYGLDPDGSSTPGQPSNSNSR